MRAAKAESREIYASEDFFPSAPVYARTERHIYVQVARSSEDDASPAFLLGTKHSRKADPLSGHGVHSAVESIKSHQPGVACSSNHLTGLASQHMSTSPSAATVCAGALLTDGAGERGRCSDESTVPAGCGGCCMPGEGPAPSGSSRGPASSTP